MSHTYTQLLYHFVFSMHERRPWLSSEVRSRVHQYLGGAIRGENGVALIVGGVADHVHILARLRQDVAISDVMRNVKANSSAWIHETFPTLDLFSWQRGYAAFTVSTSMKDKVHAYVAGQEEHHATHTFAEELRELLEKHGVEFDPKYLME